MVKQWKELYQKLPRSLKVFIFRALAIFICWQLLYHYLMLPTRVPDRFLTNITGIVTEKFYSLFYHGMSIELNAFKVIISIDGKKLIGVADPCNAFEIYVLYISFLLCYPATIKSRLKFIAIGIPILFSFNIIRICFIAWLNIHMKSYVDISHHYIFTTSIYLLTFFLWIWFTKNTGVTDES